MCCTIYRPIVSPDLRSVYKWKSKTRRRECSHLRALLFTAPSSQSQHSSPLWLCRRCALRMALEKIHLPKGIPFEKALERQEWRWELPSGPSQKVREWFNGAKLYCTERRPQHFYSLFNKTKTTETRSEKERRTLYWRIDCSLESACAKLASGEDLELAFKSR